MENGNVSLTISKEIVNPIVEAKIQEAILAALGGADKIVENVINTILLKKVSANGTVSTYSSDNKFNYIDVVVTKVIQEKSEAAIKEVLDKSGDKIKEALIKSLQTKKGSSLAAEALLAGLTGSFEKSWTSKVDIKLIPKGSV